MNAATAKASRVKAKRLGSLPNAVTMALGANLKRFRQQAQLTQLDLAYEAEVERSRISKLEGGHINPSLLTLATLCHCLKISLPDLFAGITATLPPVAQGGAPRRANQAVLSPAPTKRR